MLCREWRSAAVDCGCDAFAAGAEDVGTAFGKFGRRPFLAREAKRSFAFKAGKEAAWFWTLFSWVWLAF